MLMSGMASSSFARDVRTVPNIITLSRIALLPIAGALYFNGHETAGIILAIIAGLTDYADGAIARATGTVTRLGEILDQFCDLCYEASVLTVAIYSKFFPPWIIVIYLFREFWVVSIRRYAAGRATNIPSNLAGKAKTNFLMWGFLPAFLSIGGWIPQAEPWLTHAGHLIVGFGLFLSYISGIGYTRAFVSIYDAPLGSGTAERR
jgi:CDP-diacylglycerol--glycerol-3-phosphate 3-phosphatidyltransferase